MILDELLHHLRENKVDLWLEGDRLRYKGSETAVTQEVLAELREHKSQIVEHLRDANGASSPQPSVARSPTPAKPATLEYKFIGRSGLKSAELALGPYSSTMINPGANEEFSRLLDIYTEAGGNVIDLSNVYTRSENRVGKWLEGKRRDSFVITSKVGISAGDGPNDMGLSRKHIMASIEQSLRELGTDYVDIYYTHIWDGGTPLEETLSALNDLVRAGKVRYLGLSNYTGWQLQKAIDIAKYSDKEPILCLQTQYNLLDRYPEWEQIPVCQNEGLGLMAWGSLAAGWLTGRYRRGMSVSDMGARPSLESQLGMNHNSYRFRDNERTWKTLDMLLEVAEELDKTPAQVALNWLKDRPGVIPILGPRNAEQLKESLGAIGWSLADEQRARLDQASQLQPIMPHMFVESVNPVDRR